MKNIHLANAINERIRVLETRIKHYEPITETWIHYPAEVVFQAYRTIADARRQIAALKEINEENHDLTTT